MKNYLEPAIEIVELNVADVITTSTSTGPTDPDETGRG